MLGNTHFAMALLAARCFGFVRWNSFLEILFLALVSYLPDIDQPKGWLAKFTRPVTYRLHEWFGHRSATHSIIFLGIGICFFGIFSQYYAWLFLIGYGGHILADMFTYSGVKLFYPYKYRLVIFDGPLLTGKIHEKIIFWVCIAIFIIWEVWF